MVLAIAVKRYPFFRSNAAAVGSTSIEETTNEPTIFAPIAMVKENRIEWLMSRTSTGILEIRASSRL